MSKKTKDEQIADLKKRVKKLMRGHWWGERGPSDRDVMIFALQRALALEEGWASKPIAAT